MSLNQYYGLAQGAPASWTPDLDARTQYWSTGNIFYQRDKVKLHWTELCRCIRWYWRQTFHNYVYVIFRLDLTQNGREVNHCTRKFYRFDWADRAATQNYEIRTWLSKIELRIGCVHWLGIFWSFESVVDVLQLSVFFPNQLGTINLGKLDSTELKTHQDGSRI